MAAPERITGPLLDVLEVFLEAWENDRDLYGWAIIKRVKRSGPTVYGILDRIESAEWITGEWERESEPGRPRRRLYRLTPNGHVMAGNLLAERRPAKPAWRSALARVGSSLLGGSRRGEPGVTVG